MATSIGVKLGLDGESEFRKGLNEIISCTKSLDKQMQALESSFGSEKKSLEENQKQTELLEKKKEALEKQIEETSKALDYAKQNYEEGSKEISSWESALADAETQLNNTDSALSDLADEAKEMQSPLGELTSTISEQEAELESLKDEYVNAVLEFGEGSDEAEELAGQIRDLSSDLSENKDKLNDAKSAADDLTTGFSDVGGGVDDTSGKIDTLTGLADAMDIPFASSIGEMANQVAEGNLLSGGLSSIITLIGNIASEAWESVKEFDNAESELAVMTGYMGDDLQEVKERATAMWMAINDEDTTIEDTAAISGMFETRFKNIATNVEQAEWAIQQYASAVGDDGATAVSNFADIMQQWNLVSEDSTANTENLTSLVDIFTTAQAACDMKTSTLASALTDQAGTFQALDMTVEQASGLLVAYEQAGGKATTMTQACRTAVSKLSEAGADVPTSFQNAINSLQNCTSVSEALSTKVEGTDLTIEDLFGTKRAQELANTFMNNKVNVDEYTDAITDSKGATDQMYEASRTTSDGLNQFGKAVELAFTDEETFLDGTKTGFSVAGEAIQDWLVKIGGGAVDMGEDMDAASSDVLDDFKKIKKAAEDGADFKIDVEVPEVTISKSETSDSIKYMPSVNYKHYARGYDEAMLLNSPTIFGAQGNNLLVGGDRAGTEVVVGEEHLLDMIASVLGRNGATANTEINMVINGAEGQDVEELAEEVVDRITDLIGREKAIYG